MGLGRSEDDFGRRCLDKEVMDQEDEQDLR
jgi:hypothetical protein